MKIKITILFYIFASTTFILFIQWIKILKNFKQYLKKKQQMMFNFYSPLTQEKIMI